MHLHVILPRIKRSTNLRGKNHENAKYNNFTYDRLQHLKCMLIYDKIENLIENQMKSMVKRKCISMWIHLN